MNSVEEARQVSGLAGALWEEDAMPPAMVRAFQLAGTGMYGARADGRLVGFVLAFLGSRAHVMSPPPRASARRTSEHL